MSVRRFLAVIRPLVGTEFAPPNAASCLNRVALAAFIATLFLTGCGGGSTSTPISITVSQTSATVTAGQTQTFMATVAQDSQNKGVAWTLSGMGCNGNACGTLSATSSASGVPITYNAPPLPPTPPTVILTATSLSDSTKSSTITIMIGPPAINVTVAPATATVLVNATQSFIATLQNDSQNKGVNWTLTLAGAACTAATCGAVAQTTSLSAAPVNYTAPAAVPAGTITLTATSVTDSTKSAAATITVTTPPKISVTVAPATATLATGAVAQTFTATLQNDSQNKGVNWTLSGASCTGAACGSVSPASSLSGAPVTYTSPTNTANLGTVLLTATSVADATASASATITLGPAPPTKPLVLGEAGVDLGFGEPVVATDAAGNIDVAWINNNGPEFVRSTDGGNTFSAPLTIPSNMQDTVEGNNIQMGLDANGNINLLWHRELTPSGTIPNSFFSRSTDGGMTFSAPVNPGAATAAQLVVAPQGNITILWFDATTSTLFAANSADGVNFGVPVPVAVAVANTSVMDLAAIPGPQGQIYVFWTQVVTMTNCSILSTSSLDAGSTFHSPTTISTGAGSCNQTPSATADSSGNVDVAWDADGAKVFFSRSTTAGASFSLPINLQTTMNPTTSSMTVGSDGTIYVLVDTAATSTLSRSVDSGATFSATPTPLVSGGGLVVDACSDVTVIGTGNQGVIQYQRSMDGGATFSAPNTISDFTFNVGEQFAIDKTGNVHIVWGVDGPPEIEYVRIPTTCNQ